MAVRGPARTFWLACSASFGFVDVSAQTPLGSGTLPPSPGSGFSGLGSTPGCSGLALGAPKSGPFGAGVGGLGSGGGAMPQQGGSSISSGVQLPTLNILGNSMQGQSGSATPQHIQQMQAQAVQSTTLDSMCPGKQRSTTNIGEECWKVVWTAGGCKAENVPKYEEWHRMQSLEVLVGDVVQWANLPDDRHKQGCYGDNGPPQNEPAPPMPSQGGPLSSGGPLSMGSPLSGGPLSGGMGLGGLGQQQNAAEPPEVSQKIMSALQSPDIANVCPGVARSATAVGADCWKNIWRHVGCLESTTPSYEEWHNTQSFEVLVADAAQWASLSSAKHKQTCYGINAEL